MHVCVCTRVRSQDFFAAKALPLDPWVDIHDVLTISSDELAWMDTEPIQLKAQQRREAQWGALKKSRACVVHRLLCVCVHSVCLCYRSDGVRCKLVSLVLAQVLDCVALLAGRPHRRR